MGRLRALPAPRVRLDWKAAGASADWGLNYQGFAAHEDFIRSSLRTHLGAGTFAAFGTAYEPFVMGGAILFFYWLTLYWMYRRKIFLRI